MYRDSIASVTRGSPSMRDRRLELMPIASAIRFTWTRAATRRSFKSRPVRPVSVVMSDYRHVRDVLSRGERQIPYRYVPKRAKVAVVKTPAERGRTGAWAYDARADADLSVEEVAERLARAGQPVRPSTIRGIESGSKQPSRRLLKAMAQVYGKPVPGEPVASPGSDGTVQPGLAALIEEMRKQNRLLSKLVAQNTRLMEAADQVSPLESGAEEGVRRARTHRAGSGPGTHPQSPEPLAPGNGG